MIQDRINVLISEPGGYKYSVFLPYMWATLKTFYERYGGQVEAIRWLDPIYQRSRDPLKPYEDFRIDIVGLSCYTWNWDFQLRIAAEAKLRNPNCLVIAGGPQPDHQDEDFFVKHRDIDVVVLRDGEITFSNILTTLAREQRDFSTIKGLYLPGTNRTRIATGPPDIPGVFEYSPFLSQSAYFEKLISRSPDGFFSTTWETNRGCPYSCSFCDWGTSSTMTRVRRFELQKIKEETDWIGRMKIGWLIVADANFGILERDLEISDWLLSIYKKYGFPTLLYYSPAKNNPDRSAKIAKKLAFTGIAPVHFLSIEHTNKEVLAATDRQNISVAKQLEIVKSLQVENIPVAVQLILGIPGDTYDLWKTCLTDLMEWGIHDDYWVFSYNLLPNAPAAAKDFVEKWQIKTIERFIPVSPVRKRPKDAPIEDFAMKGRLIVETKSFSRSDWVKMQTFSAFVHALHNRGVTRLIAKYLRFSHNMPYRKFYEDVIDNALGASNLYQSIYQNYQHYLVDEQKSEDMEVDQFKYCLFPSRWLAFQICYHLNSFFADLKEFLTAIYPEITNLKSVIEYQKNMIITPAEVGRRKFFSTEFEWVKYFQIQSQYTVYEPQPEPDWAPGTLVEVRDAGENLQDYSSAFSSSDADWNAWVSRMLLTRNAAEKNIFSDVRSFRGNSADA